MDVGELRRCPPGPAWPCIDAHACARPRRPGQPPARARSASASSAEQAQRLARAARGIDALTRQHRLMRVRGGRLRLDACLSGLDAPPSGQGEAMPAAAILDVDGTLVDTNYHHALAWYRAFRQHGIVLPIWRIHRHIGMGGDQLVEALAGDEVEERAGRRHPGGGEGALPRADRGGRAARGRARADRGPQGRAATRSCWPAPPSRTRWTTTSTCSTRASSWTTGPPPATWRPRSPSPTSCRRPWRRRASDDAVMVGDSTWDCEAAKRAGVETVAVLTGGFSEQELLDAGAAWCSSRSRSCASSAAPRRPLRSSAMRSYRPR